jgi:hypothetical protein
MNQKKICGVLYEKIEIKKDAKLGFNYDSNMDVIPNIYEGGFTLWECTIDLMNFLKENENFSN